MRCLLALLFMVCLLPIPAYKAQTTASTALSLWGGNGYESLTSCVRTPEGDFVLLAQTNSTSGTPALSTRTNSGKKDGWVLRVSRSGELTGERLLAYEGSTCVLGTAENPEGACHVIVESVQGEDSVVSTGYVVRCDAATGSVQREPLPGQPHQAFSSGKGMLLTGACAIDGSRSAAWCALVDGEGQLAWSYCPEDDSAEGIALKAGVWRGEEVVLFAQGDGEQQALRVLDGEGRFLRDIPLPDEERLYLHGMLPTEEGVLLYGYTFSGAETSQTFFLHVDLNGNVLLSRTFSDMQSVLAVCPSAQGGYVFVENADDGLYVFHLSSDGETQLQQRFPYGNLITCRYVCEEPDGSLTCVGDLRVKADDGRVLGKLFILCLSQKIQWSDPVIE